MSTPPTRQAQEAEGLRDRQPTGLRAHAEEEEEQAAHEHEVLGLPIFPLPLQPSTITGAQDLRGDHSSSSFASLDSDGHLLPLSPHLPDQYDYLQQQQQHHQHQHQHQQPSPSLNLGHNAATSSGNRTSRDQHHRLAHVAPRTPAMGPSTTTGVVAAFRTPAPLLFNEPMVKQQGPDEEEHELAAEHLLFHSGGGGMHEEGHHHSLICGGTHHEDGDDGHSLDGLPLTTTTPTTTTAALTAFSTILATPAAAGPRVSSSMPRAVSMPTSAAAAARQTLKRRASCSGGGGGGDISNWEKMSSRSQRAQRQQQRAHSDDDGDDDDDFNETRRSKADRPNVQVGLLPGVHPAFLDKYKPTNEKQRRAPREDLSTLTEAEKQERRKERARMYSHLARRRQEENVVELMGIVEQLYAYRTMVEEASDYIVILSATDRKASILFATTAFAAKQQKNSLLGQSFFDLVVLEEQKEEVRAVLQAVKANNKLTRLVRNCRLMQGESMNVSISMRRGTQGIICVIREEAEGGVGGGGGGGGNDGGKTER